MYFLIMYLAVFNPDTGDLLYSHKEVLQRNVEDTPITEMKDCLAAGVIVAKSVAGPWRLQFPNAFAQVNCKWEPQDAPR